MKIGEVIGRAGRVWRQLRSPERAYAPSKLSLEAQNAWRECDKWSRDTLTACGLDTLDVKSVDDLLVRQWLRIGFFEAAWQNGWHREKDPYGVGKSLPGETFSEVRDWLSGQKEQLIISAINTMGIEDPNDKMRLRWIQQRVFFEAEQIFKIFYECRQYGMPRFAELKNQLVSSLGVITPLFRPTSPVPSLTTQ